MWLAVAMTPWQDGCRHVALVRGLPRARWSVRKPAAYSQ